MVSKKEKCSFVFTSNLTEITGMNYQAKILHTSIFGSKFSGDDVIITQLKYSEERQKTHSSVNTEGEKDTKSKKRLGHRNAFLPSSRVSPGGRTSRETNWKTRINEKDQFNQQQGI